MWQLIYSVERGKFVQPREEEEEEEEEGKKETLNNWRTDSLWLLLLLFTLLNHLIMGREQNSRLILRHLIFTKICEWGNRKFTDKKPTDKNEITWQKESCFWQRKRGFSFLGANDITTWSGRGGKYWGTRQANFIPPYGCWDPPFLTRNIDRFCGSRPRC